MNLEKHRNFMDRKSECMETTFTEHRNAKIQGINVGMYGEGRTT